MKSYQPETTKHIIKDPTIKEDRCRKCHQHKEIMEHITRGSKIIAGTEYTERHNPAAKVVHQALATIQAHRKHIRT